ncbi:MAG: hypothetical protein WKF84_07255 [Pyrinomonadaceae bacterium]
MITGQALVGLFAVGVCVLFSSQLGVAPVKSARLQESVSDGPTVRSVFTFGLAQLGAVIGLNIAGWWLTSLVARADATLFQMGLYAVANQFRQLATIFPDLLARICYPLLTKESGQKYGGADHVMLINTYVVTAIALAVAGVVTIILPWLLPLLYGETYVAGEAPCALLLATAVVHMSGAPAANRLNILNLRAASMINAIWAVLLISLGVVLVPRAGVTGAAATFLFAHILSACLVLVALSRRDALPHGMLALSLVGMASAVALGGTAYARAAATSVNYELAMSIAMTTLTMVTLAALAYFGREQRMASKRLRFLRSSSIRGSSSTMGGKEMSNDKTNMWQVLDVKATWIKEFASALSRDVATLGWIPEIDNVGVIRTYEKRDRVNDPPLDVRVCPLSREASRANQSPG